MLAGHSYGGLVVRMFTDRYPDEVVGMVLVDASHPDQWVNIPASRGGRTVAMGNRMTALLARLGLLRLFRAERPFIDGLPAREYAEMRAYLARPQGWSAGADGLLAWDRQSRDQVNAARDLGDLPLVVLSVTEQDRYAEVLTRLQAELVVACRPTAHTSPSPARPTTRSYRSSTSPRWCPTRSGPSCRRLSPAGRSRSSGPRRPAPRSTEHGKRSAGGKSWP